MNRPWHMLLLCLVGLFAWSGIVRAASIVYLGRTFLVIDAGEENNLEEGAKVCFFQRDLNLVGCGEVKILRPRLAGVIVSKEVLSQLTLGMSAKSEALKEDEDTPKASKKEIARLVTQLKKAEKKRLKSISRSVPKDETPTLVPEKPSSPARRALSIGYLFSATMPFTFKIPAYELANEVSRSGALWVSDRSVSRSPLGVQLQWNMISSLPWTWGGGLYYRMIPDDRLTVNFDPRDPAVGSQGVTTARSFGFFAGFVRWFGPVEGFSLHTGGGLDLDVSQIAYKATTVDSAESLAIASLTSQLNVVSLRLDTGLRIPLGPVSLDMRVTGLLPVAGTANTSASMPGLRSTVTQDQADGVQSDLKKALGHERAKLGYQVALGLAASF